MRIVAGEWRGRTLRVPRDPRVRPTADRAREAWMSILQHDIPGARVVDLCAGSGALGLEALSRGAVFSDFVDLTEASLRCVKENAEVLQASNRIGVHRGDAVRLVRKATRFQWDIAFADPPYGIGVAPQLVEVWLEHPYARILTVEHEAHESLPDGGESRKYGGTRITIYRASMT